jgi:Tfp pilus assembly pilus retraction ATPase PilT
MRDPETMRIALAAAQTGHLVLTTMHTTDVAATVGRIADNFPPERQPTIRQDLAMGLSAGSSSRSVSPSRERCPWYGPATSRPCPPEGPVARARKAATSAAT